MITDSIKMAHQSPRLQYVRINRQDEQFKAFLTNLFQDPQVHALTSTMLLRPTGDNEVDYLMDQYANALLGVAICLLPSEIQDESQTQEDAKPTIIGEMVLGEGGIPSSIAHNRNTSIGIAISSQYQGKGYGREALTWGLDWAFRHANLHSVSISTASFNTRAAKLYRDIGFVEEGRRRQVIWFDRAWYDELLFSMTEEEWERGRVHKLAL